MDENPPYRLHGTHGPPAWNDRTITSSGRRKRSVIAEGGDLRVISETLMPLHPGPGIDAHGGLSAPGRGASRPVLVGEGSCRQVGGESGLKRLKETWRDRVRHQKWHRTCHLHPSEVFGAIRTSCEDGDLNFAQPPKGLASVGPPESGCLDSAADMASARGGDGAWFLCEPDPW
jgi:hypothetical protein